LLFEQLFLAGNVATITLCQHVLPQSLHVRAGNDPSFGICLDRDGKQLLRNDLLQLAHQRLTLMVCVLAVHNCRQGVHWFFVQQYLQFHQVPGTILQELVIHRGIAVGVRFQEIKEVHDDFRKWDLEVQLHPVCRRILLVDVNSTPFAHHLHDHAVVLRRAEYLQRHPGFIDLFYSSFIG